MAGKKRKDNEHGFGSDDDLRDSLTDASLLSSEKFDVRDEALYRAQKSGLSFINWFKRRDKQEDDD